MNSIVYGNRLLLSNVSFTPIINTIIPSNFSLDSILFDF